MPNRTGKNGYGPKNREYDLILEPEITLTLSFLQARQMMSLNQSCWNMYSKVLARLRSAQVLLTIWVILSSKNKTSGHQF